MRVIGFIVVVTIVVMGIYNGGDLKSFIDWGAMLVILAALIGALLMSGSTKVGIAIGGAFGGRARACRRVGGCSGRPGGRCWRLHSSSSAPAR